MEFVHDIVEHFSDADRAGTMPPQLAAPIQDLSDKYLKLAIMLLDTAYNWPKHAMTTFLRLMNDCGKLS